MLDFFLVGDLARFDPGLEAPFGLSRRPDFDVDFLVPEELVFREVVRAFFARFFFFFGRLALAGAISNRLAPRAWCGEKNKHP